MGANGANIQTLKAENRALILRHVRRRPVSRAELARITGLTKSAVTMITAEMIREGLLRETGVEPAAAGRRPVLLDIVPDYASAVGVILHRRSLGVCLTDLKATVKDCRWSRTAAFRDAEEAMAWIEGTIPQLSGGADAPRYVGIGVSSPGPLDYREGVIWEPPDFPLFHHVPVARRLEERLGLPVLLENNAVLLAMAEYAAGTMENRCQTLFVTIADGIGSAILRDGAIFRGAGGYAGEIGHISVDPSGPLCACGNRGCLETVATLAALRRRFGFEDYRQVVDGALRGEAGALAVMEDLADKLATALVGAVNLLDLDSIVLYGEYDYRPDWLVKAVERRIAARSIICRTHGVAVLPSRLGEGAAPRASVAAVLDAYFGQRLPGTPQSGVGAPLRK